VRWWMVKLCETVVAAVKSALPAWMALTVQVPTANTLTVVPDTVQNEGFAVVNVTGRPDEAVALTGKGVAP